MTDLERLLGDPRAFRAVPQREMADQAAEGALARWRSDTPSPDLAAGTRRARWVSLLRNRSLRRLLPTMAVSTLLLGLAVILLGGPRGWLPRYDMRLKYWLLDLVDSTTEGFIYYPVATAFSLAAAVSLLCFAAWPEARRALRGLIA